MPPTTSTDSIDQLPRLGGSHAQREVFEDTILESLHPRRTIRQGPGPSTHPPQAPHVSQG